MALDFKLEWFRDGEVPTQEGAFLHFLEDVPCYQDLITKEEYAELDEEDKCEFVTNLFAQAGVVEVSSKAYRLYIIKAELFDWSSVLTDVIVNVLFPTFGESSINELPGSRLERTTTLERRKL